MLFIDPKLGDYAAAAMIILVAVHSVFSSEIPPIRLVHHQSKAFFTPSRFIGSLDLNGCFNTSSCLQTWTISSNNPSEGFSLRKMIHLPPDWLWQEFSEPPQTHSELWCLAFFELFTRWMVQEMFPLGCQVGEALSGSPPQHFIHSAVCHSRCTPLKTCLASRTDSSCCSY